MKKVLIAVLSVLMLLGVCACEPSNNGTKEVTSSADFAEIGMQGLTVPKVSPIGATKYAIVDGEIAQITFDYSNHTFTFRGSTTNNTVDGLGIQTTPVNVYTESYNGVNYEIDDYGEGMLAKWQNNGASYSLYAPTLSSAEFYMFLRVAASCAGFDIGGETVELPAITNDTTVEQLEKFFYDNHFLDFDFVYEASTTVTKGHIISMSRTGVVHTYDEIIVTVSTGPNAGDIVHVPDNLLGLTEDEFVKKITDLGMVPSRLSTSYWCATIPIGGIYSYPDGDIPAGTTIKYSLSKGSYVFDANEYNGKTKDELNQMVHDLNNYNAFIGINYTNVMTKDHPVGKSYDCTSTKEGAKTVVACNIAQEDTRVELGNYVGTFNNPCGSKENACTVGKINFTIKRVYDGQAEGYISAQSVPAGKVPAGTTVELTVSTQKPYLYRLDDKFYQKYEGRTMAETRNNLMDDRNALGRFTSVVFETVPNTGYNDGSICKILIWSDRGYWVEDYEHGYYPADTAIRVQIYETLLR